MSVPRPLVRRIYDRRAPYYDAVVQALALGRDSSYRRAALLALDARSGDRVLDVGCGTGRNFPLLARGGVGALAGCDVSARSLAKAAGRGAAVAQADAARLPYRDGAFDRVLCTYVLTSVDGWRRALDELVRVLRPGGRLVVSDDRLPPGWFLGPGPMLGLLRREGWVDLHRDVKAEMEKRLRGVALRFLHLRTIYVISGEKAA
ncbi:MAG: methyltransferase domain-containing protein [Planctomycetia bacterium]|nr:methyltransferase domain-containing protein [Planctomycetia bacterium]